MKATIEIDMDNASFQYSPEAEAERIGKRIQEALSSERFYDTGPLTIIDLNGNSIGEINITDID